VRARCLRGARLLSRALHDAAAFAAGAAIAAVTLHVSPALALGLCAATTGATLHWTAGRDLHESTAAGICAASLFGAGIALAAAIGSA